MTETPPTLDRHLSAARFLQGSAMAGFAVFLAACGTSGTAATPSTAAATAAAAGGSERGREPRPRRRPPCRPPSRRRRPELNWANWTLLHRRRPQGRRRSHQTLEEFKAKYGTTVNYQEVIDDNDELRRHDQPQLAGRQGHRLGPRSSLTDWMAARLIRLGWVEKIDLGNMPNVVANLQDVYRDVAWDPTNDHHVPWQSGMTGLGYDHDSHRRADEPRRAVVDPKYKGKVDVPDRDARRRSG